MGLQTKGKYDICSTVVDIEKHEQFKKLPKDRRIEILQETYDKYGVRSDKFFIQVQQFIIWTIKRYLRGMSETYYLEDLVNNAYEELIIAFEGGNTTHYNTPVYKEPIYGTPSYYKKYKNIGDFIMYVVGSSVAKYRGKNFRKQILHEDSEQDISDRLNYTDFEMDNDLSYMVEEPNDEPLFHVFRFNKPFLEHLYMLRETKPRNNVLYNFMLWREHE